MRPSLLAMIAAAGLGGPVSGVLPIVASIPALYSTVYNFPSATNAPQPYFSLGMGSNANPTVATSIYVDTSLTSQGGTGVLKDDLMLYDDANRSTYLPAHFDFGPGDSSGFGVINGELMLVDDQAYINRGSGSIRKMYWIQSLGQVTITQPITLTINTQYARVHNNSTYTNRASSTNSNQINLTNADYPIVQLFPKNIAGISYPVGVPDSYILAGNMKRAIQSGSGATMDIVLHDYLTAGLNGANPGTIARPNGDASAWLTISQGDAGNTAMPKFNSTVTGGAYPDRVIDGFDFRGLWWNINQNGFVFTNCLFDVSALDLIYTYRSPGSPQPDHNVVLRNVRLDPNDTSGLRQRLIADNLDELVATTNARQAATGSSVGFTASRGFYPSTPGTIIETPWNPFYAPTSSAKTSIPTITIDPAGQFITLGIPVDPGYVMPAGFCCVVLNWTQINQAGTFISLSPEHTMKNCRIDGWASKVKYGYNYTAFAFFGTTSNLFGAQVTRGIQRGMINNAIIRAPQDVVDIPGGLRQNNLVTSSQIANGSHVDGTQISGGSGITTTTKVMTIDGDYIDMRPRHYTQDLFVDPLDANGLTTNPYFLTYGAVDKTFRMRTGGLDAQIYIELDSGAYNLSPVTIKNCIGRGGYYFFVLHQPFPTFVTFSNTNPLTFSTAYRSTPNTLASPNFASTNNGKFLIGLQIADANFPATPVSFNADVGLPSALSPSTVYTIVAYGYAQIYVTTTNTTQGFVVGDTMILSSTGSADINNAQPATVANSMKAQVIEIDGGAGTSVGQVTKLAVTFPGMYKYRPTSLVMSGLNTTAGAGQLTIANGTDQIGNQVNTFVLADPSGNTIDGTGNNLAGVTFASLTLSSSNNTTANFSVNDTLYMSAESSGSARTVAPATIRVTNVDGSGKITGIAMASGGNYAIGPTAARLNSSTAATTGTGTLTMSKLSAANSSASGTLQVTGLGLATTMRPQLPALITLHDNYISEMPPGNASYPSQAKFDALGKARLTGDATSLNRVGTDAVSFYNNYFLLDPWQYGQVDQTGQTLTPGGVPLPGTIPPVPALKYFSMNPPPNALTNYGVSVLGAGSVKVTFTPDPSSTISPDAGQAGVVTPMNPSGYEYRATPNGGSASAWKPLPTYPTDNGNGTSSVTVSDSSLTGGAFLIETRSVNAYNSPQVYPQQTGTPVGASVTMP